MVQRFGQISTNFNRPKRMYLKKAIPEDDHPHFLQHAIDLANVLRNIIFVDQVIYPSTKADTVLELLEQHVTENIVKSSAFLKDQCSQVYYVRSFTETLKGSQISQASAMILKAYS
ncbi:hypothetical protein DFH05DRAFT_527547 [Lentinula detonsa]|uniref:Uncharacterized protein n=1 Tax=Lentinula detonsa TaxID=2804962 RepID=A0A9W8NQY7_9AGAR|nr:hypothetical protein DFH05DRAFT_527547 [Lentinula detonsa]